MASRTILEGRVAHIFTVLSAAASITALVGCAAPVTADRQNRDALRSRVVQGRLLSYLKEVYDVHQSEGRQFQNSASTKLGLLDEGYYTDVGYTVSPGSSVVVIAVCDAECTDLDLAIVDVDGGMIIEDIEEDAYPYVEFVPTTNHPYTVRVTMESCSSNPCHYSFQILTEDKNIAEIVADDLAAHVDGIINKAKNNGVTFYPVFNPKISYLGPEGTVNYEIEVDQGTTTFIVGICDENCGDLDLAIFDGNSQYIAVDSEDDAYPYVVFDAQEAGTYGIQVDMPSCAASTCAFGLQVLAAETDEQVASVGSGTCFAVTPDGALLTSYHVIEGATDLVVRLSDGTVVPARVEAHSPQNDLAILRIDRATPDYLTLAPTRSARLGMRVFTVGFPVPDLVGMKPTFAEGTINGLNSIDEEANGLQISIPVQPGNSGGPVVDESGRVLGIVEGKVDEAWFYEQNDTLPQNMNWAIKADYARPMFNAPRASYLAESRDVAIEHTRKAVCYLEVTSGSTPASNISN